MESGFYEGFQNIAAIADDLQSSPTHTSVWKREGRPAALWECGLQAGQVGCCKYPLKLESHSINHDVSKCAIIFRSRNIYCMANNQTCSIPQQCWHFRSGFWPLSKITSLSNHMSSCLFNKIYRRPVPSCAKVPSDCTN